MAAPHAAVSCEPVVIGEREIAEALIERAQSLTEVLSLIAVSSHRVVCAASIVIEALSTGHLVLVCGNGGSAAEAQHLAGELVGRFQREREPWPVLALTSDPAVMTAVANDYGFDTVFERQVAAFGGPGDVLIGISTSGESANVVNAAKRAHQRGMSVVAFTGPEPTRLSRVADVVIAVPSSETALVQEVHSVLVHLITSVVEDSMVEQTSRRSMNR